MHGPGSYSIRRPSLSANTLHKTPLTTTTTTTTITRPMLQKATTTMMVRCCAQMTQCVCMTRSSTQTRIKSSSGRPCSASSSCRYASLLCCNPSSHLTHKPEKATPVVPLQAADLSRASQSAASDAHPQFVQQFVQQFTENTSDHAGTPPPQLQASQPSQKHKIMQFTPLVLAAQPKEGGSSVDSDGRLKRSQSPAPTTPQRLAPQPTQRVLPPGPASQHQLHKPRSASPGPTAAPSHPARAPSPGPMTPQHGQRLSQQDARRPSSPPLSPEAEGSQRHCT